MKKFFTLIAAVALAASVNAQTAKVFTSEYFLADFTGKCSGWYC